jgi:hypothetical protein
MDRDKASGSRLGADNNDAPRILSEEQGGVRSTPRKDLIAALCIAAFSIFAMVLAVDLPNPGGTFTHPGLLPFLTGLTLLAMAVGLGISAVRAGGAKALLDGGDDEALLVDEREEGRRTLILVVIIGIYVYLADIVTFDLRLPTPLFVFQFSSYEAVSIPVLAVVLNIFWRKPPWRCLLVATVFVVALTAVFRHGFHILLPGSD